MLASSPSARRGSSRDLRPDDLLVIADRGADPFALSRRSGEVFYAVHGAGRWDFADVFSSTAALSAALTGISQICASVGRDDLVDEACVIKAFWRKRLVAEVQDITGSVRAAKRLFSLLEMF